jgi:glucose/mannose transport system permease protein
MTLRWTRISPQIALTPAVIVTLVAFIGSIFWTIYLSFTRSRRVPEYGIDWSDWLRQYERLFQDAGWAISLKNLIVLGIGSTLAIVFGYILAAMIDRERRGESLFRTVFLYPLAVSLIVTGVAWRWILNPDLGLENFLHGLGFTGVSFNWLADPQTAMYAIILASIWQSSGFYMALMIAGLKGINGEIWSAARLDGVGIWRLYVEQKLGP